jgi:hypothetical protein
MELQEILPFIVALLASGSGAFILVLIERWLAIQHEPPANQHRRIFYWGTAAFMLLLVDLLVAAWEHLAPDSGAAQFAFLFILIAIVPLQVGALVFLLTKWQVIAEIGQESLLFLLPVAALLIVVAVINTGLILLLLAATILIALLWQIKGRALDWLSGLVLLALLIQKIFQPDMPFLNNALTSSIAALPGVVVNAILAALMILAYVLPALLVFHSLNTGEHKSSAHRVLRLGLAVLLLLLVAYDVGENAFWASAQSRFASDNFPFQAVLPLVFGLLLALFLSGWRRLVGAAYGLLVPALLIAAFVAGWNISNTAVTEGRAQSIENALASYYQHYGRYPDLLDQLTPGYLPFELPPAGNNLDRSWCYQSGPDAYRLGYISVKFTVPYRMPDVSVAILQQVGNLPQNTWECVQKAQAVKAVYTTRFHR